MPDEGKKSSDVQEPNKTKAPIHPPPPPKKKSDENIGIGTCILVTACLAGGHFGILGFIG